jgi:hypothetical protein
MIGCRITETINPETTSFGTTNTGSINLETLSPKIIIHGALLGMMTGGVTTSLKRAKREETTEGGKGAGFSNAESLIIKR